MSDGVVADTSAWVELIRQDRPDPPQIGDAASLFIPLPALGELFAGAYEGKRRDEQLAAIDQILRMATVLKPDAETAREYGRIRGILRIANLSAGKRNDLWIAALCLQHELPLLAKDRGFDEIPNLKVLHW